MRKLAVSNPAFKHVSLKIKSKEFKHIVCAAASSTEPAEEELTIENYDHLLSDEVSLADSLPALTI